MAEENTLVVDFPVNSGTRQGLTDLFTAMEEFDKNYERNYYPAEIHRAYKEIYNNLGNIESVELTVTFDEE